MIVIKNMIKLNDNNCKNIEDYMNLGLTVTESFNLEVKKNRHNINKIKGVYYRTDKWFWITKLLEMELKEKQFLQSC